MHLLNCLAQVFFSELMILLLSESAMVDGMGADDADASTLVVSGTDGRDAWCLCIVLDSLSPPFSILCIFMLL